MWITPRRLRKRTSAALLLFPNIPLITEQKSGQFTCYKTGQFYLLLTELFAVRHYFKDSGWFNASNIL